MRQHPQSKRRGEVGTGVRLKDKFVEFFNSNIRFAIDSPEKVLEEVRIKQEIEDSENTKCRKRTPPSRSSKSRTKYRRSY